MKKAKLLVAAMLLSVASFAQIKGKVVDASTGEVLIGATVNNVATEIGRAHV